MMKKRTLAIAATLIGIATAGCNSFLTGDKLSNNPNVPTDASANQLFIGVEVGTMATWESYPMNLLPLWAQQWGGVSRQAQLWSQYKLGADNFGSDGLWNSFYGPGGLADIRRVVTLATAEGNLKLVGQAKVFEALLEGTAADIWGDVPYDSAGLAFPTFDAQAAVYAHVQATLDTAIIDLGGAGTGAQNDFFFASNFDKWIATAHTLKARFYMHTAEKGDLTYDATILQSVITEAASGIADTGSSFETKHSEVQGEQNLFYWYAVKGSRAVDAGPSQVHIDIATQLNDPDVLAADYERNVDGQYLGAGPGQDAPNKISVFAIGPTTSQVLASYTENILLSAEAHYRLNNSGVAQTELNTEHAAFGNGPAPAASGANLLVEIIKEKYARDFLDPNVWFDYLRTCVPNLQLPASHAQSYIPARMPYGYTESISNPNLPDEAGVVSNQNWPKHATDPTGATCAGQVNRP